MTPFDHGQSPRRPSNEDDSPFMAAFLASRARCCKASRARMAPRPAPRAGAAAVPHGMGFEEWMRSERKAADISRAYADGMPLD